MDIAVVVNLRARRGSPAVAVKCRSELPNARILASHSLEETVDFTRALAAAPARLLVSAGGDGTAVALLNAVREHAPDRLPEGDAPGTSDTMVLGVLPLGTGNAWARVTGAFNWKTALERLGDVADRPALPHRRFELLEVFGSVAHFAGTGWDAEIIDDFYAQKDAISVIPKSRRAGLTGYMNGLFTRTIPRHLFGKPVEVELYNTGADALVIDRDGKPVPLRGGEHGKLLYRGPASVCAAGTTQEWGFGFRAFPFAGLVPGRFNMRVYGGNSGEATWHMRALWRGEHPVPKMESWLLTKCRAVFSRPVPFQVGGDRLGHKSEIEYGMARQQVDLLDWGKLPLC